MRPSRLPVELTVDVFRKNYVESPAVLSSGQEPTRLPMPDPLFTTHPFRFPVILIAQGAGRLFWRERMTHGWIGLTIGAAAALLLTIGG